MMSGSEPSFPANASQEEIYGRLFEALVAQQAGMALMFLGQAPHPESGERTYDPASAKIYIEQLEMLAAKTTGNLSSAETQLLESSITHLQMLFARALTPDTP